MCGGGVRYEGDHKRRKLNPEETTAGLPSYARSRMKNITPSMSNNTPSMRRNDNHDNDDNDDDDDDIPSNLTANFAENGSKNNDRGDEAESYPSLNNSLLRAPIQNASLLDGTYKPLRDSLQLDRDYHELGFDVGESARVSKKSWGVQQSPTQLQPVNNSDGLLGDIQQADVDAMQNAHTAFLPAASESVVRSSIQHSNSLSEERPSLKLPPIRSVMPDMGGVLMERNGGMANDIRRPNYRSPNGWVSSRHEPEKYGRSTTDTNGPYSAPPNSPVS